MATRRRSATKEELQLLGSLKKVTPLEVACARGHVEAARALVAARASLARKHTSGGYPSYTPLGHCASADDAESAVGEPDPLPPAAADGGTELSVSVDERV